MDRSETRNLWKYFVLAYAITWAFAIPSAIFKPPEVEPTLFDIAQLGALGPAIAALAVIYLENGREGLQEFWGRVKKWRIGLGWYLVIVFLPLIWLGILPTIGVYLARHGMMPEFLGPAHDAPPWREAWWFFFYILLIGGGQEELGWRGYALPKLQTKYNALVSSLILGVLWSGWHLPMFFIPGSIFSGTPFPIYMIMLMMMSVVYTWLYNNTESILACILYHTWSNFAAAYLMVNITDPIYGLLTLAVQLALVVGLIVVFGPKRLSRNRARN